MFYIFINNYGRSSSLVEESVISVYFEVRGVESVPGFEVGFLN